MMQKLIVTVYGASGLAKTDVISYSDPYCVLTFQGQERKTKVEKDSSTPNWNESFSF
jgi:Ca2+-dependent lipid-binding protein